MTKSNTSHAEWLHRYTETSQALERIRTRELAAMTDAAALDIMRSLTAVGTPWRERPNWSGLVEQQAIFQRGRTQQ